MVLHCRAYILNRRWWIWIKTNIWSGRYWMHGKAWENKHFQNTNNWYAKENAQFQNTSNRFAWENAHFQNTRNRFACESALFQNTSNRFACENAHSQNTSNSFALENAHFQNISNRFAWENSHLKHISDRFARKPTHFHREQYKKNIKKIRFAATHNRFHPPPSTSLVKPKLFLLLNKKHEDDGLPE